jgi:hypothetical protein
MNFIHLGVRRNEMLERQSELVGMGPIAAPAGPANVFGDHVPDRLAAVGLVKEILPQRRGGNLRDVLMLGERIHLISRQAA